MSECVCRSVCFAVFVVAVSMFNSQTVDGIETNKTDKLNVTRNVTHLLPVDRPCSGKDESLCINGLCSYPGNINKPYCTCHPGFLGKRCEHMDLTANVKSFSSLEEVLEMVCVVILLLVCVCLFGCCCYRKCSSKPAPPFTKQESRV